MNIIGGGLGGGGWCLYSGCYIFGGCLCGGGAYIREDVLTGFYGIYLTEFQLTVIEYSALIISVANIYCIKYRNFT